MNIIWLIIMLCSLTALIFSSPELALSSMLEGANSAVSLSLSLLASYALWLGLFAAIDELGLSEKLARILRKPIAFLFPGANPSARKLISMNISANLLGLGNAATPMGINAVCAMHNGKDDKASDNMIMLLVISSTSLQLIPSTVIGMRISHGAQSPTEFLPACLIATVASTAIGIALVKLVTGLRRRRKA